MSFSQNVRVRGLDNLKIRSVLNYMRFIEPAEMTDLNVEKNEEIGHSRQTLILYKFLVLILSMNMFYVLSFGQNKYVLKGKVVDENNQALIGASVFLYPLEKGVVTDSKGLFVINNLNIGNYKIEISFIGFNTIVDSIKINGDKTYNVMLNINSLKLQEVIITDNYAETRKKEESLNIEIVNKDYLNQYLGGSLMKSIERLPGVSTIDIGSGQSKPVIRGLGFNRVVVVENNIKHEAQQWGADHGLEIDQYFIDNIEVVKGPASLMYGSDAIGGVIAMRSKKLPAVNSFGGTIDLSGKTNNNFLGTSILLYGRKKFFFVDARFTLLDYSDYKVPTDSVDIYSYRAALHKNYLRNTAGNERNLHFTFGYIRTKFQSKFYISNFNSENGFFANAHGLEPRNINANLHDKSNRDIIYPYQSINHFKIINTSLYQCDNLNLEVNFGLQRNYRQEWSQYVNHGYMPAVFIDTFNFSSDLERLFEKYVYSGNFKLTYFKNNKTQITTGFNADYQENSINGRGFIIPAFTQINLGGYILSKHNISRKSIVQTGLRYDFGNINTSEQYDWFVSPIINSNDTVFQYLKRADNINRNFNNVSWSIGYNYNIEKWSLKTNVGKSFRMPIAKELASNGVNYHNFSYEVGNSKLSPEISYQLDAGIEYSSKKFVIGTTPFLNYFSNYIYLNPTSEHDRLYGNGNQVFYYTQSEVFRYGLETHSHYQLFKLLQLGIIGEYVYSEQLSGEKKGFTLPFSPPASAIFNVKFQRQKIKFIENAYLSIDYKIAATQNNIVPPEETTDGYRVVNLSFGGNVILANQKLSISLQVQNLLNKKYFNHTSYYKLINVPEPGRNLIVNISIPFSGKIKQK